MSEQKTVVDIEPARSRRATRTDFEDEWHKLGLEDLVGVEYLGFATAIVEAGGRWIELRDRRKERRFLIIATVGLAAVIGLVRLAMQLVQS